MPSLNTKLLEFLNGAGGYYRPLDELFVIATSYYTLIVVGAAVMYYMGLYLPFREERAARMDAFKRAGYTAASLFLTWVAVSIIKVIVAFPRPFQVLTNLHVLISLPDGYSFPSGHAALTMALATAVYFQRKRLGELLFAFAFVVGLSRLYLGVHYPVDVGVGFLIGYLIPKAFQLKGVFIKNK